MKKISSLSIIILCLLAGIGYGQRTVDIKLYEKLRTQDKACYEIQLRSPHGSDILLAGQNYRLFYDASKVRFIKESVNSRIDDEAYTAIELINTTTHNIGFLSLSIDGRELNDQVQKLSRSGSWHPTVDICFEPLSDRAYDLTWAHPDRTAQFASASVAMSEWITQYEQQIIEPNEIIDFKSQLKMPDQVSQNFEVRVFPNPVVDFVNVEVPASTAKDSRVIIKDIIGREVVYEQLAGKYTMMYDLTNWPEGIYSLEILNSDGHLLYTDQVVKARP